MAEPEKTPDKLQINFRKLQLQFRAAYAIILTEQTEYWKVPRAAEKLHGSHNRRGKVLPRSGYLFPALFCLSAYILPGGGW